MNFSSITETIQKIIFYEKIFWKYRILPAGKIELIKWRMPLQGRLNCVKNFLVWTLKSSVGQGSVWLFLQALQTKSSEFMWLFSNGWVYRLVLGQWCQLGIYVFSVWDVCRLFCIAQFALNFYLLKIKQNTQCSRL